MLLCIAALLWAVMHSSVSTLTRRKLCAVANWLSWGLKKWGFLHFECDWHKVCPITLQLSSPFLTLSRGSYTDGCMSWIQRILANILSWPVSLTGGICSYPSIFYFLLSCRHSFNEEADLLTLLQKGPFSTSMGSPWKPFFFLSVISGLSGKKFRVCADGTERNVCGIRRIVVPPVMMLKK